MTSKYFKLVVTHDRTISAAVNFPCHVVDHKHDMCSRSRKCLQNWPFPTRSGSSPSTADIHEDVRWGNQTSQGATWYTFMQTACKWLRRNYSVAE